MMDLIDSLPDDIKGLILEKIKETCSWCECCLKYSLDESKLYLMSEWYLYYYNINMPDYNKVCEKCFLNDLEYEIKYNNIIIS